MVKSYGVVVGGGPQDFSVSPSHFGTNWDFELIETVLNSKGSPYWLLVKLIIIFFFRHRPK